MSASLETNIPQPRVRPLVGNAPDIDSETPIQSMVELARELGPIYRLSFGKGSLLVLSSLELVADACDETRFDKKVSGGLSYLRDFVADGLFTAHTNEPNWAKAHRILMPAFGPASMRNYFEDMLDIADQMLTKWERLGPEASIDVADNMTRLTLDTIALSGFGYRFNSFYQNEMHPLIEAMVRFPRGAVVLFLFGVGHRQPGAGDGAGVPAKFRDHRLADSNAHVIDAGAPAARDFARGGDKLVAELARLDEGDAALRGDGALVVAVAGKGEGGIGKREDEATMGDALAVHHVGLDRHDQRRAAGADLDDLHAERARGVVFLPHRLRAGAREIVGR